MPSLNEILIIPQIDEENEPGNQSYPYGTGTEHGVRNTNEQEEFTKTEVHEMRLISNVNGGRSRARARTEIIHSDEIRKPAVTGFT